MGVERSTWKQVVPVARRMLAGVVVVSAVAAGPAAARESGIQFSPDRTRVFVSKDVGGQRFAITLNTDDGTVTGNVFSPEGGDPKFVFCTPTPPDVNRFSCAVADKCIAAPCDGQFIDVGERTLPPDFFDATGVGSAASVGGESGDHGAAAVETGRQSGIQFSPDGKRIFVSKDVGGQRFAITRNADDHTVTGNVFSFDGGAPKFIVCVENGSEVRVRCAVADPCSSPACPEAFVDVGDRQLPPDFFVAPDAIVGASALTGSVTDVLDVGVATIPSGSALTADALQGCPDGGSVDVNGGTVTFTQCRVGTLVCSGDARVTGGGGLSPTSLACHDDARVKDFVLSGVIGPDAGGATVSGSLQATTQTGDAFDLTYDGVAIAESTFGTPQSGKLTIQNPSLFFGGSFTKLDQSFDGTQFIRIVKFFPKSNGFIQVLVFDLDVTTGKLIPR